IEDEGRPFGAVMQVEAPNHHARVGKGLRSSSSGVIFSSHRGLVLPEYCRTILDHGGSDKAFEDHLWGSFSSQRGLLGSEKAFEDRLRGSSFLPKGTGTSRNLSNPLPCNWGSYLPYRVL